MDHIELIKGSDLKLKLKKKGILQQDIVKQLLKNGIDAFDLMKQMRHQELATTQKYLSQLGNVNKFIKELKGDLILPIS